MPKMGYLVGAIVGISAILILKAIIFGMVLGTQPFTLLGYTVIEWNQFKNLMYLQIAESIAILVLGVSSGVLIGGYLWKDDKETN